jgi:predicted DNA-binding transcriptional regulator YafY
MAALREAAQSSGSVWMSYMDQTGTLSERIVDPVRVDAGWLTAYDHRTDVTRRFAVHRIRQVAPV